ncbi:MAG: flagellar filament capping protein FliD [Gammaproteobacteria bacterium]|nr:flagellar filament capping protein FliD [Gammaproteobacteria bacterium]
MAGISSLGIGSGLDLNSIVSSLVEAERAPTESRYIIQEQNLTMDLSAFGLLRSSLSIFQGSLGTLNSVPTLNARTLSNSDDSVLSASAASTADVGSYELEVSALARAHSLATDEATAFSGVDETVGTGTMTIRFGTTTTGPYAFNADASKASQDIIVSAENNNTTLSGLREYINENDFGVQAAIIDDGNGYRMVLTSLETGAANSMEIDVTGDDDSNNFDNAGLSRLAFNANAQSSLAQTVAAQDAELSINGLDITRETNSIAGAISGVTLNLKKADVGNIISIDVSENQTAIKSGILEFVDGYNGMTESINSLTNYDAVSGNAGVLIGDFTVQGITRQLRNVINSQVAELTGDIKSLVDIGITTGSIDGTLEVDMDVLNDALSNYPSEIEALFTLQGRPTDSDVAYLSAASDTAAGDYAVNITTLATRGSFAGTSVNKLTIDDDNDSFTLVLDGVTSETINLAQGVYIDGDALATQIQAQINDDTNIKAGGASVMVAYDSLNNEFDITSSSYGSESSIEFTTVDTNTAIDFGFSVSAAGTDGVDVAGTINGLYATGVGQVLTSQSGDSDGLVLTISGNTTGARGSVSFSRGLADTADSLLSQFLETDGFISYREDGINERLEEITEKRAELDLKIESLEARLVKQFAALDYLVAQFNNTSTFLSQQLNNLPGWGNSNKD